MTPTVSHRPWLRRSLPLLLIVAAIAAAVVYYRSRNVQQARNQAQEASEATRLVTTSEPPTETNELDFPQASWEAANIALTPVTRSQLVQTVELTGKITLNEDHVAHVYPLVEGRVEEVKVRFGQRVKKGDLLVVIQSKEVGQGMLQLYKDRIQRDFVEMKDRWTQEATTNTLALIQLIRDGADIKEIEKQLSNQSMGEYRDRLMAAYIGKYKSSRDVDRLSPLSEGGAVAGKQLLAAETDLNAARATLQSSIEQIQQEARQAAAISAQSVKELQTTVSVDETNLKIIGFNDETLRDIDPAKQGDAIAYYSVYAPFDGTVISKDVALLERVGPERQILSIADLSTVWVSADIYEENLPLLERAAEQEIDVRTAVWPDRVFKAKVFYKGDLVNEASRTISMRAVAENADGLLKPGMFVNVEIPSQNLPSVIQVPATAIQDFEGKSFVFVHQGEDRFIRRDVTVGRRNDRSVEIVEGLADGESVVATGGFALKSRMLAELLAE